MKQLKVIVLFVIVFSFAFFLLSPDLAYAGYPDECRPRGGRCLLSCSGGSQPDYQYSCPQLRQTCCMPPASCEARGGTCTPWIPGGPTCGSGGAQVLPNTCGYPEICCRYRSCWSSGGVCTPFNPGGTTCSLGEIIGTSDCQNPGSSGPICCVRPGGGGGSPPPPRYTISGQVFVDNNRNGTRDSGEPAYQGAALRLTGRSSASGTSNSSGNYSFSNLLSGNYTVTITIPSGFINVSGTQHSVSVGPSRSGRNFAIVNIYTISGAVFNDISKNRLQEAGETKDWAGNIAITTSGGNLSIDQSNGTFTISNLFAGTYTVQYTSALPGGYFMIFPLNGPPPSLSLTVGPNCPSVVNLTAGHRCTNGNLSGTNFAISNSIPWLQSYGFNLRLDEGFEDKIPAAPLYPPYASVADKLNTTPSRLIAEGTLPSSLNGSGPYKVYVNGLTVGQQYRIVVSGTYYYDVNEGSLTDAQWDDWLQNNKNCFCRQISKVLFNEASLRSIDYLNAYNPAHVYTYLWTANSSQLEMYIPDTWWADNSGSLSYQVYTQ